MSMLPQNVFSRSVEPGNERNRSLSSLAAAGVGVPLLLPEELPKYAPLCGEEGWLPMLQMQIGFQYKNIPRCRLSIESVVAFAPPTSCFLVSQRLLENTSYSSREMVDGFKHARTAANDALFLLDQRFPLIIHVVVVVVFSTSLTVRRRTGYQ